MDSQLVTDLTRASKAEIMRVSPVAPFTWLRNGWHDLRRHWGTSLGYGALIVALGWTLLVFCGTHPYFVAAAISGFLLVGPVMSAGLCEMSRRYSRGEHASFDDSLDGFARNAPALMEFGLILAICAAGWFFLSGLLLGTVFHVAAPSMSETLYRGFIDSTNRYQVAAYVGVGGLLATAVFVMSVVTIPMIVDQHATVRQAMGASLRCVLRNLPAMLLWSSIILGLTIIGYMPLLAGMLVIAPLLGHATWHAYTDMICRPHAARQAPATQTPALAEIRSEQPVRINPNDTREAHLKNVRDSTVHH